MWEECYGREPFDLRLTVLRLTRCLGPIALITLAGSILFGCGYYVKKVLLVEPQYTAVITCKIEYVNPPVQSGDYYINAATWNTYVDSEEFLDLVQAAEPLVSMDSFPAGAEELREAVSADVASDIHVPSFTVTCGSRAQAEILEQAVAGVLTGPWADRLAEVASVEVINLGAVHPVTDEFYRPVRAFVFGAVTACFFAVVLFLLREIGADSIWLPSTLRTRYGLTAVGTVHSRELAENIRYVFSEKEGLMKKIAVCAADGGIDPGEVLQALRERKVLREGQDWTSVQAPALSPEAARSLRGMDGVLLVVAAGLHTGKPLEYVLEYLREQDIKITAVLLWGADEFLLRAYYLLPDTGKQIHK